LLLLLKTWDVTQSVVSIEPYDGLVLRETIDLNFFTTWIQLHKIPVGYRKESLIKNLIEKKDAKVVKVELNVLGAGNFVRAKVRLGCGEVCLYVSRWSP
jgi:hypothetical protein